jgi:hypothetical protein
LVVYNIAGGVKNRPFSTTSERELIVAMAGSGRAVTLANLVGWRREGLLPPLVSRGLGTGKGKCHYWAEPNILAHAKAAYDFLHRYGRPEVATWMLWLSGYSVPLPLLRRVWSHRSKMRKMWTARPAPRSEPATDILGLPGRSVMGNQGGPAPLLLQAILALSASLMPDDGDSASIVEIIERALAHVSRANGHSDFAQDLTAGQLWLVMRIVSSALENSDLISIASDDELREAQKYIRLAGILLSRCDDQPLEEVGDAVWQPWLAERMAAPVFLLVLVLLRSGCKPMLEQLSVGVRKIERQVHRLPVQHSYSAAQA